jgi:murein DD-endopeptidase MepM/ murein hydrolase activator NlpD
MMAPRLLLLLPLLAQIEPAPLDPPVATPPPAPVATDPAPSPAPAAPAPAAPPARFDRSLDDLERQGVITNRERTRLEAGPSSGVAGRLASPARVQLCASGALSRRECQQGIGGTDPSGDPAPGEGHDTEGRPFRLSAEGLPLPPITVPVSALLVGGGGSFSLSNVLRVTPRPAPLLGNGNRRLLFPLIGSAVTTSPFGWRLHPVLGSLLLHSGRDLAAPEGTPVVATLDGTVVSAGLAGGYGLAVELEHDRPSRRTLYGHLSELFVQPGERVRQGEVIGRVGSTGLSTGPHLHFEVRESTAEGWVAVDPGDLAPSIADAAPRGQLVAELMDQLLRGLERRPPAG